MSAPEAAGNDVMVPQVHGGAIRHGGGRPLDVVARARRENRKGLEVLCAIRDDPKQDAADRIKAVLAVAQISGVTRRKPVSSKRATFSVVRATPLEQQRKVAGAIPAAAQNHPPHPAETARE